MKKVTVNELAAMGLVTRRKKAAERLEKVAKLKDEGLSGPEIAERLGEKVRTIYSDFAKLKRMEESEDTE